MKEIDKQALCRVAGGIRFDLQHVLSKVPQELPLFIRLKLALQQLDHKRGLGSKFTLTSFSATSSAVLCRGRHACG